MKFQLFQKEKDNGSLTLHVGCWLSRLISRNNEMMGEEALEAPGCLETPC